MVAIIQCSNGVLYGNSVAKWMVIMYMLSPSVCFPVISITKMEGRYVQCSTGVISGISAVK